MEGGEDRGGKQDTSEGKLLRNDVKEGEKLREESKGIKKETWRGERRKKKEEEWRREEKD